MPRTLAMILAGGSAPALSVLSDERAEAAIPFAGKFRIVDFTLSNCVNSALYNVGVLTQYRPRSLHEHLGVGRPWDLDRAQGGMRILHPSPTPEGGGWQRGTADAVRYNRDFIEDQNADDVLLLAGDHVYHMDYRPLLAWHNEQRADLTMAVHSINPHEAYRYGMVEVAPSGRVTSFVEKPRGPSSGMASMGVYVFRKGFLLELLGSTTAARFGMEILPVLVREADVFAYQFNGYWADVGTVQAYYEANIGLLAETPALDLYNPDWVTHTRSTQRPGAEIASSAQVDNSLISDGARIEGIVTRSIISPGVVVAHDAIVRDSIILNDAVIGAGSVIDRCIIDENAEIAGNVLLGDGHDNTPNRATPEWLNTGLTLVGTRASIPDGVRIGRNVVVCPRTPASAFAAADRVPSGATVGEPQR